MIPQIQVCIQKLIVCQKEALIQLETLSDFFQRHPFTHTEFDPQFSLETPLQAQPLSPKVQPHVPKTLRSATSHALAQPAVQTQPKPSSKLIPFQAEHKSSRDAKGQVSQTQVRSVGQSFSSPLNFSRLQTFHPKGKNFRQQLRTLFEKQSPHFPSLPNKLPENKKVASFPAIKLAILTESGAVPLSHPKSAENLSSFVPPCTSASFVRFEGDHISGNSFAPKNTHKAQQKRWNKRKKLSAQKAPERAPLTEVVVDSATALADTQREESNLEEMSSALRGSEKTSLTFSSSHTVPFCVESSASPLHQLLPSFRSSSPQPSLRSDFPQPNECSASSLSVLSPLRPLSPMSPILLLQTEEEGSLSPSPYPSVAASAFRSSSFSNSPLPSFPALSASSPPSTSLLSVPTFPPETLSHTHSWGKSNFSLDTNSFSFSLAEVIGTNVEQSLPQGTPLPIQKEKQNLLSFKTTKIFQPLVKCPRGHISFGEPNFCFLTENKKFQEALNNVSEVACFHSSTREANSFPGKKPIFFQNPQPSTKNLPFLQHQSEPKMLDDEINSENCLPPTCLMPVSASLPSDLSESTFTFTAPLIRSSSLKEVAIKMRNPKTFQDLFFCLFQAHLWEVREPLTTSISIRGDPDVLLLKFLPFFWKIVEINEHRLYLGESVAVESKNCKMIPPRDLPISPHPKKEKETLQHLVLRLRGGKITLSRRLLPKIDFFLTFTENITETTFPISTFIEHLSASKELPKENPTLLLDLTAGFETKVILNFFENFKKSENGLSATIVVALSALNVPRDPLAILRRDTRPFVLSFKPFVKQAVLHLSNDSSTSAFVLYFLSRTNPSPPTKKIMVNRGYTPTLIGGGKRVFLEAVFLSREEAKQHIDICREILFPLIEEETAETTIPLNKKVLADCTLFRFLFACKKENFEVLKEKSKKSFTSEAFWLAPICLLDTQEEAVEFFRVFLKEPTPIPSASLLLQLSSLVEQAAKETSTAILATIPTDQFSLLLAVKRPPSEFFSSLLLNLQVQKLTTNGAQLLPGSSLMVYPIPNRSGGKNSMTLEELKSTIQPMFIGSEIEKREKGLRIKCNQGTLETWRNFVGYIFHQKIRINKERENETERRLWWESLTEEKVRQINFTREHLLSLLEKDQISLFSSSSSFKRPRPDAGHPGFSIPSSSPIFSSSTGSGMVVEEP